MLRLSKLSKTYGEKLIVHEVDFTLDAAEIAAVHGPSGTGKTTLLHMIAGIVPPDSGIVEVCGQDIYALPEQERRAFLAAHVGLVFQSFHVIPYLTVMENILLPGLFHRKQSERAREERAARLLERVQMEHLAHRPIAELSGGQRQRVAVVRALAHAPMLVLADEPTGNLDERVGLEVMDLLHTLSREEKVGVLLVTHEQAYLQNIPTIWELSEGTLLKR